MSKRSISQVLDDAELAKGLPSESKRRLDLSQNSDSTTKPPRTNQNSPESINQSNPLLQLQNLHPYPNLSTPPKSIPFQQPTPLTSFSYDSDHVLHFNDSALRYYRSPPPNAQLGYGYERWIRRPEDRSRIDSLLRGVDRVTALSTGSTNTDANSMKKMNLADVGVVAWRGVVTRILTAPYEDREGWEMNVMLVNGTMYLEEHRTEAQIIEKNDIKPHHRKMMYYGYAFESYCTTDTPSTHSHHLPSNAPSPHPPGWGGDVDTNIQWCSIVRTKLGDIKFIIGGEVDCVQGQYKEGTTDTFVELKTSMSIRGAADEAKFEKKLLKFYFQSFLLGVPKIVVGFRSPSGQLTTTQSFNTIQIPRMVREKTQAGRRGNANATSNTESLAWNPSICLEWGYGFLTFLKQQFCRETQDDPSLREEPDSDSAGGGEDLNATVWRVNFVPREGARVTKLDKSAVEEVVNGEDRVGFLPRWYWDKVNGTSALV